MIQSQILQTNIARTVWQTVRRFTNEILGGLRKTDLPLSSFLPNSYARDQYYSTQKNSHQCKSCKGTFSYHLPWNAKNLLIYHMTKMSYSHLKVINYLQFHLLIKLMSETIVVFSIHLCEPHSVKIIFSYSE